MMLVTNYRHLIRLTGHCFGVAQPSEVADDVDVVEVIGVVGLP